MIRLYHPGKARPGKMAGCLLILLPLAIAAQTLPVADQAGKPRTYSKHELLFLLGFSDGVPQSPDTTQPASARGSLSDTASTISRPDDPSGLTKPPEPVTRAQEEITKSVTESKRATAIGQAEFKKRYNRAIDLYNSNQYTKAIMEFNFLIESSPHDNLIPNCHYWKGECLFAQKKWQNAIESFIRVLSYSSNNQKIDDAYFKLGRCYLQTKEYTKAKQAFQKVVAMKEPVSEYKARAQAELAKVK